MFEPVTRASFAGPEAIDQALVAEGPVYLEIATDLLRAEAMAGAPVTKSGETRDGSSSLDATSFSRPLLWVGGGARGLRDDVVALAERLGAPVIETYTGRGVMPLGHPLRVGLPPHVPSVGALWDSADLVISIGSDLDGMNTQNWAQPQPPSLWAINTDQADASKNYRVDAFVDFDVRGSAEPWADLMHVRAAGCHSLDSRALRFLDAFEYAVPHTANVVCDMCIPGYWIAGFHPFSEPRKLAYPMGWGTLGFGFPAAIGTALAGTGPTVAVCGDGGFLFACGELATIAQEQIPLTTVIVDDGGYGMLRFDQDQAGEPRFGVDLHRPDFAALAGSFGVRAETVEGLDDAFGEALAAHVEDPAPSVLVAKAEALTPPPTTSPQWYRRRPVA
jgi:acetolactate synthase-1/2/3 large subunit